MILEQIKQGYIRELAEKSQREDGRGLLDYRQIQVTKGFAPNAEGSAMAQIGKSKVLAGIKYDVMAPFADRPTEGVVMVNSEFSPVAHPEFRAGPPDEHSIELARVVDRGIRSAKVVNVENMLIAEGKVQGIFIDLYIIDHDGNLIDTAALAAMAALKDTKVPKFEDGKIIRGQYNGSLPLQDEVVCTSFEKIGKTIMVDATDAEEIASSGRLSLSTANDEKVCSSQKSGAAGFSKDEYLQMVDWAMEKRQDLLKYI